MKYIKTYEKNEDKSLIASLYLSTKNLNKLSDLSEYTNLDRLECSNNQLTSLPELPTTLKRLICYNNKLTSLPDLPKKLIYLDCENNKLTSLPKLPKTLTHLFCENNELPFEDLKGYNKWYQENKHIIYKEGLEYAYKLSNDINIYNL